MIDSGRLGTVRSVAILANQRKHERYFDVAWRREPDAGPILINLVHDIDHMRFVCGEITQIHCMTSNHARNLAIEDTAALSFRFESGALGSATVSDHTASPWVWDIAAGESPRFPRQDVNSAYIMGSDGALTLPRLEFWHYRDEAHWEAPITVSRTNPMPSDPFVEQIRHFADMIENGVPPRCSALDGLMTLKVALVALQSSQSGHPVDIVRAF